ncbi:MAG: hypothetical protein FWH11_06865 [Micrococcales bacterium]|nr:hypothetical protein [Micrococcales bacterium]
MAHSVVRVESIWSEIPAKIQKRVRKCFSKKEFDRFLKSECVWVDGDVTLTRDEWVAIDRLMVVKGDLEIPGDFDLDGRNAIVTGRLVCDRANSLDRFLDRQKNNQWFGTVVARQYALFMAADDEVLHGGWRGRLDTPRLFAWFVDWRRARLQRDTTLFLMCPGYRFTAPEQDEWYNWRDEFFVLKPRCVEAGENYCYDDPRWKFETIDDLLDAGESLYIDGYDPACQPVMREARSYLRDGRPREAFAYAKRATEMSPGYCKAWELAGDCLFSADAFAQAVPYYERAVELFPSKHRGLEDTGLDYLAWSLLCLGELDRAVETATVSIDRTKHLPDHIDDEVRGLPYRVRGEAWLWKGEPEKARDDLLKSCDLQQTVARRHLLALVYHRLGDEKKAQKHAQVEEFGPLDEHTDMYCMLSRPVVVDWEEVTVEDVEPVRDADHWLDYLRRRVFGDPNVLAPVGFQAVPAEFLTKDFCTKAADLEAADDRERTGDPDAKVVVSVAAHFPESAFDTELATTLVRYDAFNLAWVPRQWVTKELLMGIGSWERPDLQHVPTDLLDAELVTTMVERGAPLAWVPARLVTKDLLGRVDTWEREDLAHIPADLLDTELADTLTQRGVDPWDLPEHLVTDQMWRRAVERSAGAIEKVPARLRTDDLWLLAVAHASRGFLEEKVPRRYLEPDMLCRALDLSFGLVERLEGKYVDTTVFEHAEAICDDAEYWEWLCTVHGPEFRKYHALKREEPRVEYERRRDEHIRDFYERAERKGEEVSAWDQWMHLDDCPKFARDCWAAFWTEDMIVAEIERYKDGDSASVSVYDLLPHQWTQRVAVAMCAPSRGTSPLYYVDRIPAELVTADIAERMAEKRGYDLQELPVRARTAKVCELALARNAKSPHMGNCYVHMPLEHRTVETSVAAVRMHQDNAQHIPLSIRYEVLGSLLDDEESRGDLDPLFLRNQRGLAAAATGRVDDGIADFDTVVAEATKAGEPAERPRKKKKGQAPSVAEQQAELAHFYTAYALRTKGDTVGAEAELANVGDALRAAFDAFVVTDPPQVTDFDKATCEDHLRTASKIIQESGDLPEALEHTRAAWTMLEEARFPDDHLWSHVMDQERYLSFEVGDHESNQRVCQAILDRFDGFVDWPYLSEHNQIRHIRRTARNILAWRIVDSSDATQSDLEKALKLSRASLVMSPIEDDTLVGGHWDTLARILLRLTDLDPGYQHDLDKVLRTITKKGLADRGAVVTPEVVAALGLAT